MASTRPADIWMSLPGVTYKAHVLEFYDECVRDRRPVYSESFFLSPVGLMPLSDDGERVNMVLELQLFFYVNPAVRSRHFIDAPPHRENVHTSL